MSQASYVAPNFTANDLAYVFSAYAVFVCQVLMTNAALAGGERVA
jgi:hypothetical protein